MVKYTGLGGGSTHGLLTLCWSIVCDTGARIYQLMPTSRVDHVYVYLTSFRTFLKSNMAAIWREFKVVPNRKIWTVEKYIIVPSLVLSYETQNSS